MAATFPTSPTNGQTAVVGGVSFVYDSTAGVWNQLQSASSTPTLTSPTINTSVSGTAIKDEDNMASNSATALATQQSIKAYVDASSGLLNIVEDTSPQLGANLDVNGFAISWGDNELARFGNADDLKIFHDGTDSRIEDRGTGNLILGSNGTGVEIRRKTDSADEAMIIAVKGLDDRVSSIINHNKYW